MYIFICQRFQNKVNKISSKWKYVIYCRVPPHKGLRGFSEDIIISFHLLLNGDTHFILEYYPAGWMILEYYAAI